MVRLRFFDDREKKPAPKSEEALKKKTVVGDILRNL